MKIKTLDKIIAFLEKITKYFKKKRKEKLIKLMDGVRQQAKVYYEEFIIKGDNK